MKKIVFLLFICLNLFAQKVYDLRDNATYIATNQFFYNNNDFEKNPIDRRDLEKLFKKEYSEMEKLTNDMDMEDKLNELIAKAKALAINPKIGDMIITGEEKAYYSYKDGKFILQPDDYVSHYSSVEDLNFWYYFFPESKEYARKLADDTSSDNKEKIRYEISGIIKGLDQRSSNYQLKDIKISFFDKDNNKILLKEFSAEANNLNQSNNIVEYK